MTKDYFFRFLRTKCTCLWLYRIILVLNKTYCLLREKSINLFSGREYVLKRLQTQILGISLKYLLKTSIKFLHFYLCLIDKTSNFNIMALMYALYEFKIVQLLLCSCFSLPTNPHSQNK